ncbi:unnamed protein product [Spirodela intermedia]|uniref:SHSP domain-containing protein n=1 Tax=Spirodela intermedia TaxID=51605 RepID=A0A7I8J6L4_SPIIN|nr:unnamed protein product [Spirodela intermedia]CAA6665660.1 unnamed protein product [Spirodela intermedia]
MAFTSGFFTCSSSLGTVTVSTPFSIDARTRFTFAFSGSRNRLRNPPLLLSTREMSLIPAFFGRRSTDVFDPFSLDVWDPFPGTSAFAAARVDWKETPEAHVFTADLPGVKKEEVKVEVEEGRILQISGQRSKEKEEKNDTWHRNAKVDLVRASMENGVLTVTVPKEEEQVKKPEVKAIEISG